eukprot:gnl/MRDRNA2_/MRDRNA2_86354_c0_seq3.p1 gnl/MRDRNA2_/MRDRNA2_86354_c0~~gnl/MRDRNA2_/MRDRNA2_86354_c0_seq3.p1  ORF type:complete len:172 (-),score=9.31 gnl/MRDRNA2_/MRDRNA2_86354_c0_seq3:47-562(-)
MSSGLIIGTTCFESHFYLQWQMCCYFIAREYFVSCHGFPISTLDKVCGRILEGAIRARSTYGERCRVDDRGKPACSRIHSISHLHLQEGEEPVGLVVIKILTGRQHQIRVHLQHVGHPTVYDGRYVEQDVLLRGLRLADADRAPPGDAILRPLPDRHRWELSLRGSYPWQQ